MEDTRNANKILIEKERQRDHWEDLGVDGMILKCTFENKVVSLELDLCGSG
jgi:hypothetical protein